MATGNQGTPVDKLISQFFGDLKRWPAEPDNVNHSQKQIIAYCERMSETGECLWHAMAVVNKWPNCHLFKLQRCALGKREAELTWRHSQQRNVTSRALSAPLVLA